MLEWDRADTPARTEATHVSEAVSATLSRDRDIDEIANVAFSESLRGGSRATTSAGGGGFACTVNEKAVFDNPKVIAAFKANNISYLVADWTKKDEKVARALSSHGRVGVPMYLMYDESGKPPKVLPQLLTPKIVIDALEE